MAMFIEKEKSCNILKIAENLFVNKIAIKVVKVITLVG